MIFFQVAPSELEDLIRQHEGVTEVAVTSVPDERARGDAKSICYQKK